MKILVLTWNPLYTDLCKQAFSNVTNVISHAEPLKTLEHPIEDQLEAVMMVSDNLSAGMQQNPDYEVYVSIEGATLKDDPSLAQAHALAIRYRAPGHPTQVSTVRITPEQDAPLEILNELKTLASLSYDVPSPGSSASITPM